MTDPWDTYFKALANDTASKDELKTLFDIAQKEKPRHVPIAKGSRKYIKNVVW
jgi:hypothetical protein